LIFDPGDLKPAEREIVIRSADGEWAVLFGKPAAELVVRAAFLRHLLLQLPAEPDQDGILRPWPIRMPGVRVRGARIEGVLDLADCTGLGAAGLPALALEDCNLTTEINLSNARLARLSLNGSRIVHVKMHGAKLGGTFDFSGVFPLWPAACIEDEVSCVDAHGSAVQGDVLGVGSLLVAPLKRDPMPPGEECYALRLSGAEVQGSLRFSGAEAFGGISLDGGHITGDVVFRGAGLYAKEGNALRAQAVRVDCDVLLSDGFSASGSVSLFGAKLGGNLNCGGAKLANHTGDGTGYALLATNAEIGGAVLLRNGFEAQGRVSLASAKLGSTLDCGGAKLANRTDDGTGYALLAEGAEIGGAVLLRNGFEAQGGIILLGAKLGGNLNCDGAKLANRTDNGTGDALVAENAEIGGAVLLRGLEAHGGISLLGAKLSGNLECDGAKLANRTDNGTGDALVAENAEIGGAVLLRDGFTAEGGVSLLGAKIGALDCDSATLRNHRGAAAATTLSLMSATVDRDARLGVVSIGGISLLGCRVGGNLDCAGATLAAWPPSGVRLDHAESALNATNLTTGGDVILDRATVLGRLVFEHAEIAGGLRWDGIRFPPLVQVRAPAVREGNLSWEDTTWSYHGRVRAGAGAPSLPPGTDADPAARIVLAHAQIGAALQAHDLAAEVPLLIDLGAARVYTLDDHKSQGVEESGAPGFPSGWGGDGQDGKPVPRLDLDGFVYQRIEHFPAASPKRRGRVRRLLAWLLSALGAVLASPGWVIARWLAPWRETRPGRAAARACDRLRAWANGGEDIAGPRLDWLLRQNVTRDGAFFPQPYRHLATVLRVQGHVGAARAVAIAEQDATPYGHWSPFRRFLFGRCFGYGLSPLRASITLILVLATGTALVWTAWKQPWRDKHAAEAGQPLLVLSAEREAALSAEQQLAGMRIKVGERPCGKHEIQPLFYAVDMMLPVIPLHQADRCQIAARPGTEIWQAVWAVFSILGKIVMSLGLITYSGVLKPKDD